MYKADLVVEVNEKVPVATDLPPPSKTDLIMQRVNEVKQAKSDGRIEIIIRRENLF